MQEVGRVICVFNHYIVAFYLIIVRDGCHSSQRFERWGFEQTEDRAKGDILALKNKFFWNVLK